MLKLEGFDRLQNQLQEASTAITSLEGELGQVKFDPEDPESIETAIQQVGAIVDERLGSYSSNPIVSSISASLKEKYREMILDRAAEARLEHNDSHE